jgi:hypothetical protein
MNAWKALLGLGAACAACCAIPLLGLAGGLASTGSLLLAFTGEFLMLGAVLLTMALALTSAWWWRRRQASRRAACACVPTAPTQAPDVGQ